MVVYYAHAMQTYNTKHELIQLAKIKETCPGEEIVNPKDIPIAEEDKKRKDYAAFMWLMKKYYFPAISKCNILVAFRYQKTGNYTPGVLKEIEYATNNGIRVIEL
jgi:hypothetical protein